jgi:LacI family repressor for deo operon, udp, cdd, tsx, nupC, and nupG
MRDAQQKIGSGASKKQLEAMMPAVPNINAVAKRAGVSTATVSRVLSHPNVVAPGTRRKVLRAVEHLGYVPNSAAKHLRTDRSGKLLVTVPDIANPLFAVILQAIEEAAQRAGYAVLLGDTQHNDRREERYALMLKHKEADGLIFLGHRLPTAAAQLVRDARPRCAPVVNACEFSAELGVPGVYIDNAAAAAEAMAHLYALGHRSIGVITGPLVSPLSRNRLRGVTTCANTNGGARDLIVLPGDFSIAAGISLGDELMRLSSPPSAVFCFNDEMAMGVVEAAKGRGVRIPMDLSVVGFDDIRFARHVDPPLTTIAQPMREIGEVAVNLLLDILAGRCAAPQSIVLPHKLVIRASTAHRS